MARNVFCTYLNQEAEGLDFQLYPGELGKRIFDNISKQAWAEWMKKQTMLVNEKKIKYDEFRTSPVIRTRNDKFSF